MADHLSSPATVPAGLLLQLLHSGFWILEDLVADTEGTVRRIFEFLKLETGLDFDGSLLHCGFVGTK